MRCVVAAVLKSESRVAFRGAGVRRRFYENERRTAVADCEIAAAEKGIRNRFQLAGASWQAAAPPCGGLPATAFRADPRELPPENATEVPENESSDHASPSSDNGLSRPERA